jgi:hypothetical protein
MKAWVRTMSLFVSFAIIALLGFMIFVRIAPSDPTDWNRDPSEFYVWGNDDGWSEVKILPNGGVLRLKSEAATLAKIDEIAMTTPRTIRLTGGVEEGRITWVTRSKYWGFPDYTTAQVKDDGIYLFARLRFGKSDLGVNAARLRDWLSKL